MQHLFEKKRRRRESHNLVERRRRDNINDRIQVKRWKTGNGDYFGNPQFNTIPAPVYAGTWIDAT